MNKKPKDLKKVLEEDIHIKMIFNITWLIEFQFGENSNLIISVKI